MSTPLLNHSVRCLRTSRIAQGAVHVRILHATPVVFKKKQKFSKEEYIASFDQLEEAFIDTSAESQATPPVETVVNSKSSGSIEAENVKARSTRKLSPESRLEKFNNLYEFVEQRIGVKPAVKTPLVRNSAWIHLFGLSTSPEQLEKVAALFPRWTDSRRTFNDHHAEMFVRRCEELECPSLALTVFGDHSKYGINLSLPAARHLLHSLHRDYPIEDTISAVALYTVYNLPPVSKDTLSCSTLVSACLKHNSDASNLIAKEMIPHLKKMLKKNKTPIGTLEEKVKVRDRPSVWLKWTLLRIEEALAKDRAASAEWLKNWLRKSGHAPGVAV